LRGKQNLEKRHGTMPEEILRFPAGTCKEERRRTPAADDNQVGRVFPDGPKQSAIMGTALFDRGYKLQIREAGSRQ
jgi:hypothetical protein